MPVYKFHLANTLAWCIWEWRAYQKAVGSKLLWIAGIEVSCPISPSIYHHCQPVRKCCWEPETCFVVTFQLPDNNNCWESSFLTEHYANRFLFCQNVRTKGSVCKELVCECLKKTNSICYAVDNFPSPIIFTCLWMSRRPNLICYDVDDSTVYFIISDKAFHNIIQVTHKRQKCLSGSVLYIKSCETIEEDKR